MKTDTANFSAGPCCDWKEKFWGRMRTIYWDDQVEIIECEIEAGGFSSVHKHLDKDNSFIVLSGELEVSLYPSSLRPQKHRLTPQISTTMDDSMLTVVPCVPHKFMALQKTRLIEIYRAHHGKPLRPGEGDICRSSDGGIRK